MPIITEKPGSTLPSFEFRIPYDVQVATLPYGDLAALRLGLTRKYCHNPTISITRSNFPNEASFKHHRELVRFSVRVDPSGSQTTKGSTGNRTFGPRSSLAWASSTTSLAGSTSRKWQAAQTRSEHHVGTSASREVGRIRGACPAHVADENTLPIPVSPDDPTAETSQTNLGQPMPSRPQIGSTTNSNSTRTTTVSYRWNEQPESSFRL